MTYRRSERSKLQGERRLGALNGYGLGGVFVVIQLNVQFALGFFGHEVGTDERVDVDIHDPVDVSGAELGAVVLDHAVRLHDVGANLAAEGDVQLGFVELVGVGLALLYLEIVESGAQHFHGHFAVFALAALGLAADDDVGGDVGYADGGFDLVDVLAAFATGAEGVDAQVFRTDIDFNAVVNLGNDEDGGEGRVAAGGLIERRNAHEAVYTSLAGQQSVGVFTRELDGRGLDARLFAGSLIKDRRVYAFAFCPAQVHAQEHGGPILRFGAAGARLDGHDGVEMIGFAGEKRPGFQLAVEVFQ